MATSLMQSAISLPVSTHSSTEFTSPCFLSSSANLNKTSFLCSGELLDQTPLLKTFLETLTARSTSLWLHLATVQSFSPVAGFIVSNFFPSIAFTYLPLIKALPSNFNFFAIAL